MKVGYETDINFDIFYCVGFVKETSFWKLVQFLSESKKPIPLGPRNGANIYPWTTKVALVMVCEL